ncbi:MAG: sugar phosphate isomerase/epimerase [Firmicutes bacterium]|nr:sugar phosphate isomerase/epimerase [Bacillota bacterium]
MKLGFNGATSMNYDLETDICLAKQAGFELLEIWAAKLNKYLENNSLESLKQRFEEANVKPYSINSIEFITFKKGRDYEGIKAECKRLCSIAKELDCPKIVVVPSPTPEGATEQDIIAESVTVLRELSAIAAEYDVDLAFEFLGFSHISVSTLDLCYRIVRETDRPNIGLVLDTFHFYAGGSGLEEIEAVDRDKIFIFHINDAEARERSQLKDAHRLFPGEGVIPLKGILERLAKIGYENMVSIELFRPEYWELPPDELGARSFETVEQVLRGIYP